MNYKLIISYRGTNYHGFAKQDGVATIEQTILDTMYELFNINVKLFASGRTDKFVHALKQVINIKHDDLNYESDVILHALNAKLPSDILVLSCEQVGNEFHARFSAKTKTYIYKINIGSQFNVFEQDLIYQYNRPIELQKITQFANVVMGEHNFLSFSTSELDNTIRSLTDFTYQLKNDLLTIKVTGNGFLRNMVRMLVGVLLDYNEDKVDLEHIQKLLTEPKKGAAIRKAPGGGLYLFDVNYV